MFARLLHFFDTLRRTLSAFIFLLLIGALVAAVVINRPSVPDDALLVLKPKGEIVEALNIPISIFPSGFSSVSQTRLRDLIRVIRSAKDDARIHAILLDTGDMGHASLVALQALGDELDAFKKSGKKIYAYADNYSQGQYLLAAHADAIWLDPMGMVLVKGFSSYRNYFRQAFDKMHVTIHLFRAGEYKSAAEPLVRNAMSQAAKRETKALLDQLWSAYKLDIARQRNITPAALQNMLDHPAAAIRQHDGDPAKLALDMHLVDHLGSRAGFLDKIINKPASGDGITNRVAFKTYLRALGSESTGKTNQIGILTASGAISDGFLEGGGVNGDAFSKLIEKTAKNDAIKAVVLRIDSPGGSVQASEKIRNALSRLRKTGKPLIVSMGGMAASGGYWIAAEADEIWAAPTTLTGSIGVFAVFPNLSKSLASLGIASDGVGTTRISGGLRPDRPLPKALADTLQAGVDHVYTRFLDIVAKGRHLTHAQTEKIAEGRVWTGADAKRLGLADKLGGLDAAIAAAAERAGLEDGYDITYISPKRSFREQLLENLLGDANAWLPRITLPIENPAAHAVRHMLPQLWHDNAYLSEMLRPSGGVHAYSGLLIR